MTLQASGTIWASQIRDEFQGSNPWYISDYRRGGARVPNVAANNAIPTGATIVYFSNYYGTSRATIAASANPAEQIVFQPEPAAGTRAMSAGTTISGAGITSCTWTRLSGLANISSTTALNVAFTQTISKNSEHYSVWRCTANNGLSIDITVHFHYYTDV